MTIKNPNLFNQIMGDTMGWRDWVDIERSKLMNQVPNQMQIIDPRFRGYPPPQPYVQPKQDAAPIQPPPQPQPEPKREASPQDDLDISKYNRPPPKPDEGGDWWEWLGVPLGVAGGLAAGGAVANRYLNKGARALKGIGMAEAMRPGEAAAAGVPGVRPPLPNPPRSPFPYKPHGNNVPAVVPDPYKFGGYLNEGLPPPPRPQQGQKLPPYGAVTKQDGGPSFGAASPYEEALIPEVLTPRNRPAGTLGETPTTIYDMEEVFAPSKAVRRQPTRKIEGGGRKALPEIPETKGLPPGMPSPIDILGGGANRFDSGLMKLLQDFSSPESTGSVMKKRRVTSPHRRKSVTKAMKERRKQTRDKKKD